MSSFEEQADGFGFTQPIADLVNYMIVYSKNIDINFSPSYVDLQRIGSHIDKYYDKVFFCQESFKLFY